MRKPKSVSEFSSERNLLLLENFRRAIARQSEIALANAFKDAAERPAPRFWVSETRAAVIIGKILAGKDPTSSMTPEKREMYQEILRRFIALRATRPRRVYTVNNLRSGESGGSKGLHVVGNRPFHNLQGAEKTTLGKEGDMTHSNTSSPSLSSVEEILRENRIRLEAINSPYDPIAGDPNDPERVALDVPGLAKETLWIPRSMATDPMVASLKRAGDINAYIDAEMHVSPSDSLREVVRRKFSRLRIMHDFPFWAASFVFIKTKGGGEDSLFSLNRPQRKLVAALERMRREEKPIRLILLKARQWGGSTCVQLYMAWLQLVHRTGL
ncbi:MAG: hypothetical protein K2L68_04675, partial [Muribaculaceae bacterium]|nr:hypothetical protein [Muribaculaceae bacterium]